MRLEQLQYIAEIADTGSFTAAAERLYIAQPSISQSVTALEKELNVTIFRRSRLGAEPTEIGSQIIQRARTVLQEVNEIKKLSGQDYEDIRMELFVGAVPSMCATVLPKAVALYKKRFPNVSIKILEEGSRGLIQKLSRGEVDICLVSRHADDAAAYDGFRFIPLISARLMAYVGKTSPLARHRQVSFQALVEYPVILFGEEYFLHHYLLRKLREHGTPQILSTTRNPESIKKFVLETDAVGFGPDISLVSDVYVTGGNIVPLSIEGIAETKFGALIKKSRALSKPAEVLLEEITFQAQQFSRLVSGDVENPANP